MEKNPKADNINYTPELGKMILTCKLHVIGQKESEKKPEIIKQ